MASLVLAGCGGGGGGGGAIATPPAPNNAPAVAAGNTDQTAYTGVPFSYDATQQGATFTDPDGDALTYSIAIEPAGSGLSSTGGTVTGTLTQLVDVDVTITATDSRNAAVTDAFRVLAAEPVASAAQCPAPQTAAPINTAVSITFDTDIDPASVAAGVIRVQCASVDVPGSSTQSSDPARLVFSPSTPLPTDSRCTAELTTALRGVDGRPVRPETWEFDSGAMAEDVWGADPATVITTVAKDPGDPFFPQFGMLHSLYVDNQHLVLFSLEGNLRTAVSVDGGQTYTVSQPLLPPEWVTQNKWDFDYAYGGGRFHIVFRTQGLSLVTGIETIELVYLRSLDTLLEFSPPSIITNENDFYSIFSPGVAAEGSRLYFTWEQEECFGCPFDLPDQGVYFAEFAIDGGPPVAVSRISEDTRMPTIEIVGGDVFVRWVRDRSTTPGSRSEVTEIYRASDGAVRRVIGIVVNDAPFIGLPAVDSTVLMTTWVSEDPTTRDDILNHVLYDVATEQFEPVLDQAAFPVGTRLLCPPTYASDGQGQVVRLLAYGSTPGDSGTVEYSADGGRTFEPVIDYPIFENNWCPKFAILDSGQILAATVDNNGERNPEMVTVESAVLSRGQPCR